VLYSTFGSVFSETCRSSNTFKIVLICLKFSFSIFFSPQGAGRGETLGTRLMFLTIHPSSLENLNLVLKRFENTLGSIISKENTVATRFIVKVSKINVPTNVALILGNAPLYFSVPNTYNVIEYDHDIGSSRVHNTLGCNPYVQFFDLSK